jgi:hypothetical protein
MSRVLCALILVLVMSSSAHAQSGRHVSLGASIGAQHFLDGDHFESKDPGFSLLYRIKLSTKAKDDGWKFGPDASIGISRPRTKVEIAGVPTRLGRLRMIPVMIGGGPTGRLGPTSVSLSLLAGYSFNKHDLDDRIEAVYAGQGQDLTAVEAENAFVAKVGASGWHDLSSRFGVHVSLGYTHHRPMVATTLDGVTTSERWEASRVSIETGMTVGIF